MRTKTLLIGAAVLAAGVASSMAQNVYSVNVVGYVNLTVYPGFNMMANQLDVDGVDAVGTVLNAGTPSAAEGLQVLTFNNNHYNLDVYANNTTDVGFIGWYDGVTGNPSTNKIAPGSGFFVFNGGSQLTLTVTGTVLQGTNSVHVNSGYTLMSTVVPEAITLDTTATNNFPANEGMDFLTYTNVGHGGSYAVEDTYATTTADVGFIGWYDDVLGNPASPTPAVGQGFFIFNGSAATTWSRNFSVQ